MKHILSIFLFVTVSINSFSQDSLHLNKIENYLETERFEGKYTFDIDTFFVINDFTFYSIHQFANSFSSLILFKNDSIIEKLEIRSRWNRIPYDFVSYKYNGRKFLSTYWYGSTTSYTQIVFYVFEITDSIDIIYNDIVYYLSNHTNEVSETNSFYVYTSEKNTFIIQKQTSDANDASRILDDKNIIVEFGVQTVEKTEVK